MWWTPESTDFNRTPRWYRWWPSWESNFQYHGFCLTNWHCRQKVRFTRWLNPSSPLAFRVFKSCENPLREEKAEKILLLVVDKLKLFSVEDIELHGAQNLIDWRRSCCLCKAILVVKYLLKNTKFPLNECFQYHFYLICFTATAVNSTVSSFIAPSPLLCVYRP